MSTTAQSSGVLTGVSLLFNGRHTLNSIQVFGDGVNTATVNVYDNSTNSGKIAAKLVLPAATAALVSTSLAFARAVRLDNAFTVEVIGVGASAIVTYGAA
jgi:hypothetical protein